MHILFSTVPSQRRRQTLIDQYPHHTITFVNTFEEAGDILAKAQVIVTYGEDLTDTIIEEATSLQWVMVISAGIDQLPSEALSKRDILVTNARGIHPIPMSEYAISMLLQVKRQEAKMLENAKEKIWDRSVKINEISNSTMVVLGAGAIGQEVARLAQAFRMKTYGVARTAREIEHFDHVVSFDNIQEVLSQADFVVAVLPSTPETKYLLTKKHFEQMKNDAIFLNMGRGDVVSSEGMMGGLDAGEIAHAVLDVVEEEPLPSEHPLWETEGVTITPHSSGISPHYLTRAFDIFTYNLDQFEAGEQNFKNVVDHSRGY